MKLKPVKLSSLLSQVKDKHSIKNENTYKQVTVSNTGTISLREEKMGIDIGTKNQFFIKEGQLIYSRLGLHTGAFGIVPDSLDGAVVTGDMPVFEINNSKVLTEFLILSLDGDFFRNQLNGLNKGVAQSRIREGILLNLEIGLPKTIKEQEEILSKYNEFKSNYDILSKISSNNLDYIKNLKQSILGEAIEGKLTKSWREKNPGIEPASVLLKKIKSEKEELIKQKVLRKQEKLNGISDDEIPFEIPKTWNWCRLGDIINISSGNGLTSSNMNKNGSIPVFGGNGITGYHNKYNVNEETIVIGRVGFYCGSVHITPKNAWVTDNAFITYFSKNNIYRDFLFWLLKGTNLKEKENAGAQPVISGAKVYPILVSLPPLEEQKEIVRMINELTKFCDELENQTKNVVEKSEKLYKSFINNIGEYSEDEIKELLENSKSIEKNIKETVKNNLSFKNFEEFVAYIEFLQKKEETKEVKKAKKQVYNIKSSNMEILEILKDNKDGIDPLSLWQFSKHKDSIEDFYDDLKKLTKEGKIKEEKGKKGDEQREIILKLAK